MSEHRAASAAGLAPEGPPAAGQRTGLPPSADSALGPAGICDEYDFEQESHMARWAADIEAGRCRIPEESELEGPAISISLGDACDLDPALLAAMCGPDGLGGTALSAAFGQDEAADVLRPGPVLAALTEQAVSDLATLSDDQLTGALSAARRLENRAAYLQTIVIAEFARRREVEREQAKSRKVPLHCRPGQFPGEELAEELVSTVRYADERIWEATDLATRLPRTLAGMADGTIDSARAYVIWSYTWSLIPRDAAHADELLAAAAPGLRPDQLARKAAALEMKLDPEAVKRRKEHARRESRRVEVKHERSGNAMLAGRELDPVTALAAMANIDALAAKLRNANWAGSLQHLRAQVMTELLQGRNPLDRLTAGRDLEPASPAPESSEGPVTGSPEGNGGPGSRPAEGSANPADEDWQDDPGYRDEERDEELATPPRRGDVSDPGEVTAEPAPLPALINILVPAGTLLGWSATPAQVGSWGLLDADGTKAFVQAASLSPRTRFCLTLVAPDGTALAHGCARGQHPWTPSASAAPRSGDPPGQSSPPAPISGSRGDPSPSPAQAQRLADLICRLNVTFRPIQHGRCDHTDAEDHYSPSRVLKHLVRARTATCTAPACNAQAVFCDLDHTVPYPDGPSCHCNLAPKCRRHHRCKQATGWKVEQPEPGTFRWTVPSGRTYTTTPTVYDL
jgi:hypothetical protein